MAVIIGRRRIWEKKGVGQEEIEKRGRQREDEISEDERPGKVNMKTREKNGKSMKYERGQMEIKQRTRPRDGWDGMGREGRGRTGV